MEEAPEVQENSCCATEEEAASLSLRPEDPPVDRYLTAASRIYSQVSKQLGSVKWSPEVSFCTLSPFTYLYSHKKQISLINHVRIWTTQGMQKPNYSKDLYK